MAEVNMPRLSDTMEEGTIIRWLKKPGDEVKRGEVVAEVETDKANMEIESFSTGILQQILLQEGETAKIGQVIALIGNGAVASTPAPTPAASTAAPVAPVPSSVPVTAPAASNGTSNGHAREIIKSSPLARRIAQEHGIELSTLKGTGPGGRIVRDDVEDYLEQRGASQASSSQTVVAPAATAEDEIVSLTSMQKTIARRLTESKQTVPHFYVSNEIDLTDALVVRQKLNASAADATVKVSVNDMVVKACALALEKFPEVNGSYRDGQFVLHKHVNIGIAIDVPHGLVVPVIRDANKKGLRTIAREAKELISKAQAGKLTATDLEAGTFSVSNLGMMDVSEFVAVINPPQSAILAVAAARKTFVPIDNQPVVRDIMRVTLSADHRILYGATVARFLQEVKRNLQDVYSLLG